jgi:prepilin peptidase CpaA
MPWQTFAWQLTHLVVVLLVGIVMNAAGMIGAGDAKFAAAAAPFVALGDLRLLLALFAANLLAAFATHRLARHSPLRRLAPGWKSWDMGWDFPMGLSLGATLAIYLGLGIVFGG